MATSTTVAILHRIARAPKSPMYLSTITDDTPCDGSHGRFCPECASINRWADR